MHQFTVLPQALKELEKNIFKRILFLVAIVVLVLFILPSIMSGKSPDLSTWLTLLLMSVVMTFVLFYSLKKQKIILSSYKLTVNEASISREMVNTPIIVIQIEDIKEIKKDGKGAISIIGNSKINAIGIPTHIERKLELEQLLQAIRPIIEKTPSSLLQPLQYLVALAGIGLMYASYYMEDKYISTVAGVLFCALMIYSFIILLKSKNIDNRTKRLSYFILIPLMSVIGSLIMKWMN
jgi:hypothetical protein